MIFFIGCDDKESTINFVSFEGFDIPTVVVDVNGNATKDIALYTSKITGADRTFNIAVDGSSAAAGSYSVPSSVVVPAGTNTATFTVTMSDVDLGIGVNTIVISFDSLDGIFGGESKEINYIQACTEVTATLDITLDAYGSESAWSIKDSLGGTVASGGGYADGQASATETISLCGGRDYTLTFTDSYGDGMNGSYTLSIGDVTKVTGPGAGFATTETNAFDTN